MAKPTVEKLTIVERVDYQGFKSYEITHKGGWHHCAQVYPKVDWDGSNFQGYEINWSCWGNTTIEETEEFIKALQKAVKLAKKYSVKGGK